MKKETFRNMYNKCVPDKAVTRRLLQAIQEEDVANFAKKRKSADEDDTEDYLHVAITPKKKKLSPVFPAAAAVVCIIGAAVYTVNSREDIAPNDSIYEGTDVISEIAAVEVSIGADPVYTVPVSGERDELANVTYAGVETVEGGTFPTDIARREPNGPYTILDNGVQETILTEKQSSDEILPLEMPVEDVPVEAFTTAADKESKSTFGDFLNRCGKDDSGEGIKMTYSDSFIESPDDHITVKYKDSEKIFSLLREYADTERAPMAVSGEPIPAVVLEIIYFDASKYPEVNTDMDGVMTVGVRDDGIYVALTSADYFEFGCNSSALFDELHNIVLGASDLPDYSLPDENEEITYSNLGELLDSIDGAVSYRAVFSRTAEDYGNIYRIDMGCRRIMKLLGDMGNALPCEKTADTSQKVTVGLRKDITAEIYPDSVTFILPYGEYSFGTFERSDLWEPVNEVISRLDMDKYKLGQLTEKEIKERLMGLDLADVDFALSHDEELSGRYGYFYYCGQWIVFAASDDRGGSSITEVTIQKMVGEAESETVRHIAGGFIWPVATVRHIADGYGERYDTSTGSENFHNGIDISSPECAGEAIAASASGVVLTASDTNNGYGIHVVIDHGGDITTLYGHMSDCTVNAGDTVEQGQIIGYIGSSGQAYSSHCHFEVRVNGQPEDPLDYVSIQE
ncbi:MAG: M23 family metallopeptidase [Oscillospiraceae bacterium]|nr:M23 family metallopeptidase [Oscillospiraceae bacterium]